MPLLRLRSREPLRRAALHRLGPRRGLRAVRGRGRGLRPTRSPPRFGDVEAAPLLCAGIIGYQALQRGQPPPTGAGVGIYGFGGSARLTAQIALAHGARVHGMTRSREAQQLALELGAASAGEADAPPPEPLDSAILFAPVGSLVPPALAALDRGGTLAIAGIYLTDVPALNYEQHLFEERTLRSVTANTQRRRGVPGRGGPDPDAGLGPSQLPHGARWRGCATWHVTTTSTAPRSWFHEALIPCPRTTSVKDGQGGLRRPEWSVRSVASSPTREGAREERRRRCADGQRTEETATRRGQNSPENQKRRRCPQPIRQSRCRRALWRWSPGAFGWATTPAVRSGGRSPRPSYSPSQASQTQEFAEEILEAFR